MTLNIIFSLTAAVSSRPMSTLHTIFDSSV